jgi:hypothetical protein
MYLLTDTGCYADGAHGHKHIRAVLAENLTMLYRHHPRGGEGIHWIKVQHIVDALAGDPSDDIWEEIEAIEWMNKQCEPGCLFEMIDGDLMLAEEETE